MEEGWKEPNEDAFRGILVRAEFTAQPSSHRAEPLPITG